MPKKVLGDSYLSTIGAKPRPKPEATAKGKAAKRATTVHLAPDVYRKAKLGAVERDITLSDLIADALLAYLDGLRAAGRKEGLYATGRSVIEALFGHYIPLESARMGPMVLVMLSAFLFVSFRTLRGVLIPLAVIACTELWMLGFLAVWGWPVYTVTSILPVLIMAIAVALVVFGLARKRVSVVGLLVGALAFLLNVLVTTGAGFYLDTRGAADYLRLLRTLIGTALAASGSLALNQLLERDVEGVEEAGVVEDARVVDVGEPHRIRGGEHASIRAYPETPAGAGRRGPPDRL